MQTLPLDTPVEPCIEQSDSSLDTKFERKFSHRRNHFNHAFDHENYSEKVFERHTPMKSDYWNVDDDQVIEKTGHPLSHWKKVLSAFDATSRKSNDVVKHLQDEHNVPRYWARTLTTNFLKANGK